MPTYLVAADAPWIRNQVRSAFLAPGTQVVEVTRGEDVRAAVEHREPDLAILDMQIGNMGGIAAALDLRLEEAAGRAPHVPVLLLLDREADRFLARRVDAEGMLVKPFDAAELAAAAAAAMQVAPAR